MGAKTGGPLNGGGNAPNARQVEWKRITVGQPCQWCRVAGEESPV